MGLDGHVVHMDEMRNVHKILVGKPQGKGPLGRKDIDEWILLKRILKKEVVRM
jgi:hypothetical protein